VIITNKSRQKKKKKKKAFTLLQANYINEALRKKRKKSHCELRLLIEGTTALNSLVSNNPL